MAVSRFYFTLLLCFATQLAFPGAAARADTATVAAGQMVTLAVSATGTAPFTQQWFKDGVAVAGATASTLVLRNFQAANAGVYSARVTNSVGSTLSDYATLVFGAAPVFTTQPVGRTVAAGTSLLLTAAATGTPAPTYQWRRDGVNLAGQTGSTYSVTSASGTHSGTYTVVATNSAGSVTSSAAVVAVTYSTAPAFTAQPADATVIAGGSVTFTAAANGTPAPTYQWRKNGVAISGATAGTYTMSGVTTASAGTYSVVATNTAGSVTSNGAILTVNVPAVAPVFTTQPVSVSAVSASNVTFTAVAAGSPAPTYQWRKNGVYIMGATGSTYTISSIWSANAGTYSVVATNSAGTATSAGAVLTVTNPTSLPAFTTQPTGATVITGGTVTFTAVASGSPAPTYQWRKDGTAIAGATASTYTIASATTASAGAYSVVATNTVGAATSTAATLTVTAPPVFTTQPSSAVVVAGGAMTFTAVADGSPAPTYQWRKDGVAIAGATAGAYTIASATAASAGAYSVVATNSAGTVTSGNAVLTITSSVLARADFDGDGRSDILWQNILTGEHSLWLMAGATLAGNRSLNSTAKDWDIVGTGDFNSDGRNDILWQNLVTREVVVWYMAGTSLAGTASLAGSGAGMVVEGTGDFNGDGRADILWRNAGTSERSIMLMNGMVATTTVSLGVVDAAWSVTGTGDFNGDGRTDILWESAAEGRSSLWLMNGTTYGSGLSLGSFSTGWRVGGTGDFNADGKTDILWQNTVTGETKVRFMSGTAYGNEVSLGVVPAGWFMAN